MRLNWTKKQAIKHFGSITAIARALGTTTQAVSALPDGPLKRKKSDEIVGYLVRTGIQSGKLKVQEVEECN